MENRTTDNNLGTSEVHAHLEFTPEPGKGQGLSGKYTVDEGSGPDAMGQARDKMEELSQQAGDRAGQVADQARDTAEQLRDRAGDLASQAQGRAGELLDQAQSRLQSSGLLDKAQQYPMATLGVAFGVGFLLAGSSDTGGSMGKLKHQLRGAIVGGVTAALSQQLKDFMEQQGGIGGLMENVTGGAGAGTARAGTGTQRA